MQEGAQLEVGDLRAVFRDNRTSPQDLSGVTSLVNRAVAPNFSAFDPDTRGAAAGLNFEHIIAGHASPHNAFTPRSGRYTLEARGNSVRLVREAADEPWKMSSTLTYTLVAPNYIDVDFRCRAHDAALFQPRGYAVLFFANYMNDVEQAALHFRGHERTGDEAHWIAAEAPPGHEHYNHGGTYRHENALPLEYDADHNFTLNLWSYDEPRYALPFYYVRAAHGMTLIMMFDRAYSERDEIRFSLFKFKLPKLPRPACDWQYVIHRVEANVEYGFRARLVWKKFTGPEDCRAEYERWAATLRQAPPGE